MSVRRVHESIVSNEISRICTKGDAMIHCFDDGDHSHVDMKQLGPLGLVQHSGGGRMCDLDQQIIHEIFLGLF